jgi:hypothetical protein
MVYLEEKFFNRKDMKEVAIQLSNQFKDKAVINVYIFDDMELAKAHIAGNRDPRELQYDRRGWYARYDDQEVMLFNPNKKKRNKVIRINLKQEIE